MNGSQNKKKIIKEKGYVSAMAGQKGPSGHLRVLDHLYGRSVREKEERIRRSMDIKKKGWGTRSGISEIFQTGGSGDPLVRWRAQAAGA